MSLRQAQQELQIGGTSLRLEAVVLAILSRYLGAEASCRNEAAATISAERSEPLK